MIIVIQAPVSFTEFLIRVFNDGFYGLKPGKVRWIIFFVIMAPFGQQGIIIGGAGGLCKKNTAGK